MNEVTATLIDALMPTPMLVIAEDLHWMDSASQAILSLIVDGLSHRSALLCATNRNDDELKPEGHHVCTLRPEPLTEEQAAAALLPRRSTRRCAPRTWRSSRRVPPATRCSSRSSWRPARATGVDSLPDSVDAVISAQVDLLPPTHQLLLRYAAVLGRSFSPAELRAVAEPDLAVIDEATWDQLSGFLVVTGADTISFRHALLRDTLYEGLAYRRRRTAHARACDAITARLGDHAEGEAELLSLHCFHAQRFADAWRYARVAGTRALDKYANLEAGEFLERAISASRHLRTELPPTDIATAWELLGDAASGRVTSMPRSPRTARHASCTPTTRPRRRACS